MALLPALVLRGMLTYLRLVQTAVEDLFYARAINRIRRHYVDLGPDAASWFLWSTRSAPADFGCSQRPHRTLLTMLGAAVFAWPQACRWRIAEDSVPRLLPSTVSPGARL
jgi:hypothetical protein